MPHITICTSCWSAYEESSEERANAPIRECMACALVRKIRAVRELQRVINAHDTNALALLRRLESDIARITALTRTE